VSGYSIDPPTFFNDPSTGNQRLKVTVPTDILRNASAGNQIKFYIYGAYNNDATEVLADGRYAAFSQEMVIDIVCGSETVVINKFYHFLEYRQGTPLAKN